MDFWQLLMEILLLLGTAFVLGAVAQRLKQSAIIGYLLAGALMGPLLFNTKAVKDVAELGVALLLFSIGLEFSFGRLKRLGKVALGGGCLQIVITMVVFALAIALFKPIPQALALGAIVALSSTAVVLRILVDRAEIDAVHGRTALGILLLQDIAVVPLVLMVTILSHGGETGEVIRSILQTLVAAGGLVAVFYLLFYWLVPRVLIRGGLHANRELVILLAILAAIGSTWCAHAIGLSPALGAFLAGMLLGESPFASQIRSDVGSLRTLFVTLFPDAIHRVSDTGQSIHIGDATSTEVLTHIGVPDARAVIVTVPDPRTARDITAAVRALAPQTRLLVRSRFQRACKDLKDAGATTVVDEENNVGCLLAQEALSTLELGQDAVLACALAGRSPAVKVTAQDDDPL